MWVPLSLRKLIDSLKKLPGIGERSAERIAFHLLKRPDQLQSMIEVLQDARDSLTFCSNCHVITDVDPCPICTDPARNGEVVCVVERPQDVFLIEKSGYFDGRYHVLGGVISPLHGVTPEDLYIEDLVERIKREGIKEVILALSPTIEGDTTSIYIKERLKDLDVRVTRIARGLPTGIDLSFSDALTLKEALQGRREL